MADDFVIKATIQTEVDQAAAKAAEKDIEQQVKPEVEVKLTARQAIKKLQDDMSEVSSQVKLEGLQKQYGTTDLNKISAGMQADALNPKDGGSVLDSLSTVMQGLSKGTPLGDLGSGIRSLGKSFQGMLPGALSGGSGGAAAGKGGAGGAAGGIAMAVLAAVEIGKTLVDITEKIFDLIVDATPPLKNAIGLIYKAIQFALYPIGMLIYRVLLPLAKNMLTSSYEDLLKALRGDSSSSDMSTVVMTVAQAFKNIIEPLGNILGQLLVQLAPGFIAGFMAGMGEVIGDTIIWLGQQLVNVITTSLGNFLGVWAKIGEVVWQGLLNLWNQINNVLGGLPNTLLNMAKNVLNGAVNVLAGFGDWLYHLLNYVVSNGLSALGDVGNWLYTQITNGVGSIADSIGGFGTWLYKQITDGIGSFGSTLGNFATWLYGQICNGLSSAADLGKSIANGIIAVLNGAINTIRNFKIPDWVPFAGGSAPFQSIPTIPELANGGIATSATLAMIGEAGSEAVIPLNRLSSILGSNRPPVVIQINAPVYGVDQLQRVIKDAIDSYHSNTRY